MNHSHFKSSLLKSMNQLTSYHDQQSDSVQEQIRKTVTQQSKNLLNGDDTQINITFNSELPPKTKDFDLTFQTEPNVPGIAKSQLDINQILMNLAKGHHNGLETNKSSKSLKKKKTKKIGPTRHGSLHKTQLQLFFLKFKGYHYTKNFKQDINPILKKAIKKRNRFTLQQNVVKLIEKRKFSIHRCYTQEIQNSQLKIGKKRYSTSELYKSYRKCFNTQLKRNLIQKLFQRIGRLSYKHMYEYSERIKSLASNDQKIQNLMAQNNCSQMVDQLVDQNISQPLQQNSEDLEQLKQVRKRDKKEDKRPQMVDQSDNQNISQHLSQKGEDFKKSIQGGERGRKKDEICLDEEGKKKLGDLFKEQYDQVYKMVQSKNSKKHNLLPNKQQFKKQILEYCKLEDEN